MKKSFSILTLSFLFFASLFAERGKLTILYTNDIHSYISNVVKNADGEKVPGLSFSTVAAMRDELKAQGEQVALFDAGDSINGTVYGSMDQGASIIKFMNATGYDAATIGNHEFDYGISRVFEVVKEAQFPFVCSNFYTVKDGKTILPAYKILNFGTIRVAVVGVVTPETYTKAAPSTFMDKNHKKYIYGFNAGDDGRDLYKAVQKAIDEAAPQADYVVVLCHLGVDPTAQPWRSTDVIANTHGADVFIDGHSHNVIPQMFVKNSEGKSVLFSQSGCYFGTIGKITLNDAEMSSELIAEYTSRDEKIDATVSEWVKKVDAGLNQRLAILESGLYVNNPDDKTKRLVRSMETNSGDFVADAMYYHFNVVEKIDCDIAISNGGGIRTDVPAGDYSYNTAKLVQPFGNVVCLVEISGQTVLDALEWGARNVGIGENGGFLQVAGIKYTIDSSIASTVQKDETGLWADSPFDEYRVKDVQVYNRETGNFEPLDLKKKYNVAGVNYLLRNMGDGYNMFGSSKLVKDYVSQDYLITSEYAAAFAKGAGKVPHINSVRSPLILFNNYPLNYESPYGSGRITIK